MFALVAAGIGLAAGAYLPFQAWREMADPDARQRVLAPLLLFVALPTSGALLAVVATVLAAQNGLPAVALPLLAVGGAALVQGVAQGLVTSRALPAVAAEPSRLGPALAAAAVPEALTVAALVWLVLAAGASTA